MERDRKSIQRRQAARGCGQQKLEQDMAGMRIFGPDIVSGSRMEAGQSARVIAVAAEPSVLSKW